MYWKTLIPSPQNVQSSRQEALLYVFEDNEAVIKVIIKGKSPAVSHVSRAHRVALDWLFDRINLDYKIQIKYIDTKNQLLTFWPQEVSRAMSGIICCACLTLAIPVYSLLCCNGEKTSTRFKRKRSKQNQNLWWIFLGGRHRSCRLQLQWARRSGEEIFRKQDPWKSVVAEDRQGQPGKERGSWITTVLGLLKSGKLKLRRTTDRGDLIKLLGHWHEKFDLVTKKYFSTEPRNPSLRDRSGLPDDINSQEARPEHFVIGNDDPELELCAKSRSFLNRVNEQMRKRQKKCECYKRWKENIVWLGDLWLWQWNQQYSWQRITKQP